MASVYANHSAASVLQRAAPAPVQAAVEEEEVSSRVEVVQVDGLVALKIIKHCQENMPDLVTGQLLGLDVGNVLEVSNCYPFAKTTAEDESEAGTEYQIEMMRCLREVNVDNNTVGWYTSTYLASWVSETEIQFNYQTEDRIKKAVMLVYDPMKTSHGVLSLRAFRLTNNFMQLLKAQTFTKDSLAKLGVSFKDIYEEIPIQYHNTGLIKAFLYEIEEHRVVEDAEFNSLDLASSGYLDKTLETLNECLDDLGREQTNFTYHQKNVQRQQQQQQAWLSKRRAENAVRKQTGEEPLPETDPGNPIFKPVVEPSRLEYLLITSQIDNYCKQINEHASNSLAKVFLTGSLEKDQ